MTTVSPSTTINWNTDTVEAEVTQNIATLLNTISYTVPYDRTLGLNPDFLDETTEIAKAKLTAQVVELIRQREPRAEVKQVTYEVDNIEGRLVPTVEVAING